MCDSDTRLCIKGTQSSHTVITFLLRGIMISTKQSFVRALIAITLSNYHAGGQPRGELSLIFTWSTLKAPPERNCEARGLLPALWLTFRREHSSLSFQSSAGRWHRHSLGGLAAAWEWVGTQEQILSPGLPSWGHIACHQVSHFSVSWVLSFLLCKMLYQALINFV